MPASPADIRHAARPRWPAASMGTARPGRTATAPRTARPAACALRVPPFPCPGPSAERGGGAPRNWPSSPSGGNFWGCRTRAVVPPASPTRPGLIAPLWTACGLSDSDARPRSRKNRSVNICGVGPERVRRGFHHPKWQRPSVLWTPGRSSLSNRGVKPNEATERCPRDMQ